MTLQELQTKRQAAFNAADTILSAAERQKRPMSSFETSQFDARTREYKALDVQIAAAKPRSTADIRAVIDAQPRQRYLAPSNDGKGEALCPDRFSREYFSGFYEGYLGRKGPMNANLQEGTFNSGGYAVPVIVDGNVVPLAPQDSAVRRLATVIPTRSDIRVPGITVRAAVSSKVENAGFEAPNWYFGQFTLSAFGAGVQVSVSIEFIQDLPLFTNFLTDGVVSSFLEYEESLFLSGNGDLGGGGQPQGLLGNVGAGISAEPDGLGNVVSIDATWNLISALKETYRKSASWLMSSSTALGIRRAQVQSGLYERAFTRENGTDLLHGYPVEYSSQMPTAARGATPVLFGDFRRGYIIGDRGGSALILKVVDQGPSAAQGLIDLLFYRRTDGKVRVPEAIQSLTIAAS